MTTSTLTSPLHLCAPRPHLRSSPSFSLLLLPPSRSHTQQSLDPFPFPLCGARTSDACMYVFRTVIRAIVRPSSTPNPPIHSRTMRPLLRSTSTWPSHVSTFVIVHFGSINLPPCVRPCVQRYRTRPSVRLACSCFRFRSFVSAGVSVSVSRSTSSSLLMFHKFGDRLNPLRVCQSTNGFTRPLAIWFRF